MEQFEKLGKFYLGREYDIAARRLKDNLLLYDSSDLVTHAVCVGMTGSGKTGLCISLLEEAAIDNIPSIIIDPKGDLANLLLTFPNLSTDEFLPWINTGDAGEKGLSPREFAQDQAQLWREGLAAWGQDTGRVKRLKEAAEYRIYTPGSSAGRQVSILSSFAAPASAIAGDPDLLRERINTTVTSLLNLLGLDADPIQSREHILLSTIFDIAWKNGENLDLETLIQSIQAPPFNRIGVFDLEAFFPSSQRFNLSMLLNNLLAAPGFQAWLSGDPLDIDRMLHNGSGKPRASIFSIAHLDGPQRMFFVSLLLTQVLGWMRTQQGTSSLRAILYMDEVFGYFPPVANPPSKLPLMTLLKQARAYGLGVVLATQNPSDLDYKGLSNTGTWFIGRLQTERDKIRMLDGLETVEGGAGRSDRQQLEQIISSLDKRVFLMNNIHEEQPVIFHTRWALSYLAGPLTRAQIKTLAQEGAETEEAEPVAQTGRIQPPAAAKAGPVPAGGSRPHLPTSVPEYFLPVKSGPLAGSSLHYEPALLGEGTVYFADARSRMSSERRVTLLAEFPEGSAVLDWNEARATDFSSLDIESIAEDPASYSALPETASTRKNYSDWSRALKEWLYRNQELQLYYSPTLKSTANPGESERDFRIRLQMEAREERDRLIAKIRKTYAPKITSLEDRIRSAEFRVEREKEQASQQKLQTAISFGTTLLDALVGRKSISRSTLGRAATTMGRAGRIFKEGKDVERARENADQLRERLLELQDKLAAEIDAIESTLDPSVERLETRSIKPKKMDISVSLVALVWVPYRHDGRGGISPA